MRPLLVLLALGLVAVATVEAQPPAAPACEEQVTTLRIMVDKLAQDRQRLEIESAQAIARLLGRVKALEAEVTAVKKAPDKDKKETK